MPEVIVGVTRRRTEHTLRRGRRTYFLGCGVDILLNAGGAGGVGVTRCPLCGAEIRIRVAGGRVLAVAPPGAAVAVREERGPRGERVVCCDASAVFDSSACRNRWSRTQAPVATVRFSVLSYTSRCEASGAIPGRVRTRRNPRS